MPTYVLDADQTRLSFAVAGLLRTRGELTRAAGTVTVDEHDTPQALQVTIDARSLHTGLLARDLHLSTASFLHVRRYPLITYRSQHIELAGVGRYVVRGLLRLKGREHPVTLEVALAPDGSESDVTRRARVSGVLRRTMFGIPRSPLLRLLIRPLIGDEIAVTADVQAALASGVSAASYMGQPAE